MTLSERQIKEFQAIHKSVFGRTVSRRQAMADGLALIHLVYITQPKRGLK